MGNIFGKELTPKEMLRESQKELRGGIRQLDRERTRMQQSEKKLIVEIKKLAQQGQLGAARIMAKDLVRTRAAVQKFYKMKAQLQAVSIRIQTMQSTNTMAEAMKGAVRAMMRMNKGMNIPALQKIMMEFEKQGEIMDMKQEMMDDTMDGVMGEDGEEEETDEIVNQVLDEIGINLAGELGTLPTTERQKTVISNKPQPQLQTVGGNSGGNNNNNDLDDDLSQRLNNLRNKKN
eukprot:TRINITY_DN1933_c0_g1_i1.p1 TRINITY_DN1933_c0_g1~~TRINITY_DN1933_c0_g1_i1.p1  ORF type:complete len:233 (-),score=75.70 TRINITY_DN1933_c0_g1_i1:45-743(-)